MNKIINDLTIVIATLGGESLPAVLNNIFSSSYVPYQIIIVKPLNINLEESIYKNSKIKIISSYTFGQVLQRSIGFANCKTNFVLQLDDDIILEKKSIEYLYRSIAAKKNKASIAPILKYYEDNKSVYNIKSINIVDKLIRKVAEIIRGNSLIFQGKVGRSGLAFGINEIDPVTEVKVEWLPGGCIIHQFDNLVLDNFYPFAGKAFSEDLLHSYILSNKNVELYINSQSICYINKSTNLGIRNKINEFFKTIKSRLLIVKLYEKNIFLFYIDISLTIFYNYCKLIINTLLKKIEKI